MFEQYPKSRPALPPEYAQIYKNFYKANRSGASVASSASQRMERWLHTQVAKDSSPLLETLELGAGTLNQLEYETGKKYDIVEPFEFLFKDSKNINKINTIYSLIEDVPLENRYDRITSCAVLEHIDNLPFVVSKSGLLLKEGGCFRASIPSEGGFLWKAGYTVTTGLEFKLRYNLDYSIIMKHEHLNSVDEIENIVRWFFKNVTIKRYGIGKHLSLYTFICAKNPDIERCKEYYLSS